VGAAAKRNNSYQHRLIEVVYRAYADYLLARAGLADPALLEDASLPAL